MNMTEIKVTTDEETSTEENIKDEIETEIDQLPDEIVEAVEEKIETALEDAKENLQWQVKMETALTALSTVLPELTAELSRVMDQNLLIQQQLQQLNEAVTLKTAIVSDAPPSEPEPEAIIPQESLQTPLNDVPLPKKKTWL